MATPPVRDEKLLTALLVEVSRARSELRAGRSQPMSSSTRFDQARRTARLADAMESYADAAATAGIPLPYRYRDELRLYRSMLDDHTNGTSRPR
jgi:hypothetical protein